LPWLAWSPLADRLAARWFPRPPTLEAFAPIRQSRLKLFLGILAAWVLGGILEELVARGIVLQSLQSWLIPILPLPVAAGIAILVAGMGAGVMHFYQGPRAVLIITQLSILLGILFVLSGGNLWAVMLCHGLYDTIAFISFTRRKM
jgi:membrane protease YdiL (CAAX protease family)